MREEDDSNAGHICYRKFVIWRGREHSEVTDDVGRVQPNETVVLQASRQWISELGQTIDSPKVWVPTASILRSTHLVRRAAARSYGYIEMCWSRCVVTGR